MISFPAVERLAEKNRPLSIHLVPYYSWDNRGDKSMVVWISRRASSDPEGSLKWFVAADAKAPKSADGPDTAVVLENRMDRRVRIYWVDRRGRPRLYGELDAGATRRQGTYAENTWLITDEQDKPLGHFVAEPLVSRAVIPRQK